MTIFPISIICLVPALALGQISKELTLALVEQDGFNEFTIDLATDIGDSDDTSVLSGTLVAKLNLFPGFTTTDELTILSGQIEGSDIGLSGGSFLASYDFTGDRLGFSTETITPPGIVDFATGEFDASQHAVTINQGSLSGQAGSIFTGFDKVDFDFSEENFTGQGDGTGTVSITQGRLEDRKLYFEVSVELPMTIDQAAGIEDAPIDADIKVEGTLKALGETFIEIPDYATWANRADVGVSATSENEFNLTPANPNFILFSLGFDRDSAPAELFEFSTTGATLKVNQILAAGAIEIQWSDDLASWVRVPDSFMTNQKSSFLMGDLLTQKITVKKESAKKFLRVATQ